MPSKSSQPARPRNLTPPRAPIPAPAPAISNRSGEATIAGQLEHRKTVIKQSPIEARSFPPRPSDGARVEVELGTTESLGDFNFAKCFVRVTLPCNVDTVKETGEEAYTQADALLEDFHSRFVKAE